MNTYIIREMENFQSTRHGERVQAKSLTAAKAMASRRKIFQRTCLVIEAENGNVLARKAAGERWEVEG